jgi:hypothetical protein
MVHGHRNPYQLQGAIVERITVIEGDEASSRGRRRQLQGGSGVGLPR